MKKKEEQTPDKITVRKSMRLLREREKIITRLKELDRMEAALGK